MFVDRTELTDEIGECFAYCSRILSAAKSATRDSELISNREASQEKVAKIFIKYQEEWRVVIKFVPDLMQTCLEVISLVEVFDPLFDMILEVLRYVALCIGTKRIHRYWPTEVDWLTRIVDCLEKYLAKYELHHWPSVFVLVLWLSAAVKTPFDLKKFDKQAEEPLSHRQVFLQQLRIYFV